jgi:hypothetical protein
VIINPFRFGSGGDPYFANVASLLHFDGVDASTTITDVKGKTWTASGNAQLDTAQAKFGPSSLLLDGVGDFVSTPYSADFNMGTGAFTLEGFMRPVLGADRNLLSHRGAIGTQGWAVEARATGALWFRARVGGTFSNTFLASATGLVTAGSWYHWAITRSGSDWRFFLDGVSVATATNAGTLDSLPTQAIRIGRSASTDENPYSGHLDEYRITKGVARYTANFTPPAAAFPDF